MPPFQRSLQVFQRLWSRLPARHRGAVVIAIPATCLAITLGAWVWSRFSSITAQQEADHTQVVIVKSNQLLLELINAETGIRGYVVTRDPNFLEPYYQATVNLPLIKTNLKDLLGNSFEQQQRMEEIEMLAARRQQILEQVLVTVKATQSSPTLTIPPDQLQRLLYEGKEVMDEVRERVEVFQDEQQSLLSNRRHYLTYVRELTATILWFTAIASLLGSLAALYLFRNLDQELWERERLLKEHKSLLQAITDSVVDGVVTLDYQGRIELFNPTATQLFKYEPNETIGQPFSILFADVFDSQNWDGAEPSSRQPWQTMGVPKTGDPFPVEISLSEVRWDDRMIAIIRDITEFQQTEATLKGRADELARLTAILAQTNATLEDRNRELEQFAYVASHDLKAPLRAIANLSEWLEEDLQGQLSDDNQRQMDLLRGRVHRMEALINGLLAYSRVGRTQVPTETFAVEDLLEEVIDSLDPPASFTIQIHPEMPTITGKRLLLRQIFANLIGNAIKHHGRSDGVIQISVRDVGQMYEFAVADNGPGIAPQYHQKIFTIFQTLEARDTKENTGIGLSIIKKIIDTEGGCIWLESQEEQGATFYFTWQK